MKKRKITNKRRNTTPQNRRMKANKQTYPCLCELVENYLTKLDKYDSEASLEWLKRVRTFDAYAKMTILVLENITMSLIR